MEWQPIETAPKDGTWVILSGGKTSEDFYMEDDEPPCKNRPVTAFWNPDEDILMPDGGFWAYDFWDGVWRSQYDGATHWCPLPPPPSHKD